MKKWIKIFAIVLFANNSIAQNTIVTDTILQLSTCAGGNVVVPFDANGSFPLGNVFTAELSNAFGQFTNPVPIGSTPFNLGIIFATIPANTNFGFLYKIRVVSSNPAVIGDPCPNSLIITQVAQLNQILATPNDTACVGDTVTLTAINPASSYSWSTGDTTASISVTQPGSYGVTTTDFLGCESDTSANIIFDTCSLSLGELTFPASFDIYPNPSSGVFHLSNISENFEHFDLKVVNILGQTIYKRKGLSQQDVKPIYLHKKGVYFVEIQEDKNNVRKKLIVN